MATLVTQTPTVPRLRQQTLLKYIRVSRVPRVPNANATLLNLPSELLSRILYLTCISFKSTFSSIHVGYVLPLLLTCRRFHDLILFQRSSFASFEILDNPPIELFERQIEFAGTSSLFSIRLIILPLSHSKKWHRVFDLLSKYSSQWRTLECSQEVLHYLLDANRITGQIRDNLENLDIRDDRMPQDRSMFFRKLWQLPFRSLRSLHLSYYLGPIKLCHNTATIPIPPPNSVPQLEELNYYGAHTNAYSNSRDLLSFLRSTPLLRTLRFISKLACKPANDNEDEDADNEKCADKTVILPHLHNLFIGCRCIMNGYVLRSLVYPSLRNLGIIDSALSERVANQLMAHVFHNTPYPSLQALAIERRHPGSRINPRLLGMDIIRCGHAIKALAFISNESSDTWIAEAVDGLCEALRISELPSKLRRLYVSQGSLLTETSMNTLKDSGVILSYEDYNAAMPNDAYASMGY